MNTALHKPEMGLSLDFYMGQHSFSRPQTEDYIELNILPDTCFGHKNGPKRESDLVQNKPISRSSHNLSVSEVERNLILSSLCVTTRKK